MIIKNRIKRAVVLLPCGGAGAAFARHVVAATGGDVTMALRFIDTERPADVPATQFVELRPDWLPDEPDERLVRQCPLQT